LYSREYFTAVDTASFMADWEGGVWAQTPTSASSSGSRPGQSDMAVCTGRRLGGDGGRRTIIITGEWIPGGSRGYWNRNLKKMTYWGHQAKSDKTFEKWLF
jgi:hypothetical protein